MYGFSHFRAEAQDVPSRRAALFAARNNIWFHSLSSLLPRKHTPAMFPPPHCRKYSPRRDDSRCVGDLNAVFLAAARRNEPKSFDSCSTAPLIDVKFALWLGVFTLELCRLSPRRTALCHALERPTGEGGGGGLLGGVTGPARRRWELFSSAFKQLFRQLVRKEHYRCSSYQLLAAPPPLLFLSGLPAFSPSGFVH